jgi:cell division protease FtsH
MTEGQGMRRPGNVNLWYWVAALIGVLAVQYFYAASQQVAPIPYSQFLQLVREGKVEDVAISDRVIQGTVKDPLPGSGATRFTTIRVEPETLSDELEKNGVRFSGQIPNTFFRDILALLLPIAIFVGLWWFLIRRMSAGQGGLMQIGKSKARVYVEADTGVTFADVAGVDEAKDELREIVDFLREPERYGRLGGRMPKGVLLVGPPGTGKTLLSKAVAGEAKVPFFSISGAEFVEMFVGVGAARVRDLFEQARSKAPAIIFIDELDALGRARGMGGIGGGGVNSEAEQTLNQLLTEMDGFDSRTGLVILAATNRPEILDPALLRAGRFDRQVLVDRPDKAGRVQILEVHLKKVRLARDVEPEKVAALTPGFTGADLANLVNEAALLATRRGAEAIAMQDFNNGVERIIAGLEKRNRLLNPREREIVAHHEMGHAIVALSLPGSDPVHKVSIIPRGIGALGYTIQRPTEDRFLMTREELEHKIMVLLGGRAAEKLVFGHLSTGAADDLAKVTDIARDMVTRYGMDEAIGYVSWEPQRHAMLDVPGLESGGCPRSPQTQAHIDNSVRGIVMDCFERTTALLARNRAVLDRAARELLAHETLDEAALRALTADLRKPSVEEAVASPTNPHGDAPNPATA